MLLATARFRPPLTNLRNRRWRGGSVSSTIFPAAGSRAPSAVSSVIPLSQL